MSNAEAFSPGQVGMCTLRNQSFTSLAVALRKRLQCICTTPTFCMNAKGTSVKSLVTYCAFKVVLTLSGGYHLLPPPIKPSCQTGSEPLEARLAHLRTRFCKAVVW